MEFYKNRLIDKKIKQYLATFGAINVVGPKWCGKTTTSKHFSKTQYFLMDEDVKKELLRYYDVDKSLIFEKEKPILFDEWQDLPQLWDSARLYCDFNNSLGNFIFTGSTSKHVNTKHTGTGRIAEINLYPLSLYESEESNGEISLKDLFNGKTNEKKIYKSSINFNDLLFATCRGGWPSFFNIKNKDNQLLIAKDYFKQIYQKDMFNVDNKKRKPDIMEKILKSYSRNISTLANKITLLKDVSPNKNISETTLNDYLRVLEKLFLIKEVCAWNPNIRSRDMIRQTPKRMFIDPSLAISGLGLNPKSLINDLNTFGFIFENLCIRDLRIYSDSLGGNISYFRDKTGLEADAVLQIENGDYALIEIKLGESEFDKAAYNLNEIERLIKVQQNKNKSIKLPSVKMILTAAKEGYKRKDGVWVVPIGCLKD